MRNLAVVRGAVTFEREFNLIYDCKIANFVRRLRAHENTGVQLSRMESDVQRCSTIIFVFFCLEFSCLRCYKERVETTL